MLQNFPVVLPPEQEQENIIQEVEKQNNQIDRFISQIEQQIKIFQEFRTRLIADVVTGKLDVRAAAAQLPEELEEILEGEDEAFEVEDGPEDEEEAAGEDEE